MREAPLLALITALQDMGARVHAFDPVGMNQAKAALGNVVYVRTLVNVPRVLTRW